METNALPHYDSSDNLTDCCPRFNPEGWDDRELHFEDKLFLKADTRSLFHIPVNMGSVFAKTFADIEGSGARSDDDFVVMSNDPSMWRAEHYFSVPHAVPGHEIVRLSGDFMTKVFEGPFRDFGKWEKEMGSFVRSRGKEITKSYFFYTTCPRCAKVYGKNYVVAIAQVEPSAAAA